MSTPFPRVSVLACGRQDCAVNQSEKSTRSARRFLRTDGQQEQCNEHYCPCRQEKVRCFHNDIGNSTAFRHDDLSRLAIEFTITRGRTLGRLKSKPSGLFRSSG